MECIWIVRVCNAVMTVASTCATFVDFAVADDWPMYGRDATHNAVSLEKNPPTNWDMGKLDSKTGKWEARNIVWTAQLGSLAFGDPVVADGQIWIGTNNYNQWTGKVLWKGAVPEAGGTAYSNGVVAEIAGQFQYRVPTYVTSSCTIPVQRQCWTR